MESEASDHYRVLQVDARADVEVIQAAYRVLARRFHPDHSGDDAAMKRLNAAWETLGDADRRKAYDLARSGGAPVAAATTSAPTAAGSTIYSAASSRPAPADHAGPPVGHPFGTVLTYGRYEGWSLGQIALVDPDFLEWLRSVPGGRYLRPEIDAILKDVRGPLAGDNRWRAAGPNARRFEKAGVIIG
jgi:curved DNA-binding protein CbpA